MKEPIQNYAKLGLVHHLLYPDCVRDMDYHEKTLAQFLRREDIQAMDCCVPFDPAIRERLLPQLKNCGKDIAYALHLFPARKISLASWDIQEQAITRMILKDQIQMAAQMGATGFVFVSGADVPEDRPRAREAFKDFCRWFCKELKPYGITALLEPFDRTIDKKFLYGPTQDCVELMAELREEFDNIAIELDIAHLPLMFETFPEAIARCAPYIERVHLGNCVLKDTTHPLYGDMHPPMGLPGGEIDVPELTVALQCLYDCGYLSKENPKPLVMEMTPFPGKTPEYTIAQTYERLAQAWENVVG